VTKTKRGFAEAVAEAVLDPSPARVEAPCRHFGVCGGCRFQDLAYESQVAAKEQQVRDALTRIGRIAEPPLEPILPAASQYGYRNKLEYSFTQGEDGVDLGFHRAGRWDEVIGIEECLLTTDLGNSVRLAARLGARGASGAIRSGDGEGVPPSPCRPGGAEHRPGARRPRHRAGRPIRDGVPR
jgi:23S rRNA (uracil1939-C5)-methyltransferase